MFRAFIPILLFWLGFVQRFSILLMILPSAWKAIFLRLFIFLCWKLNDGNIWIWNCFVVLIALLVFSTHIFSILINLSIGFGESNLRLGFGGQFFELLTIFGKDQQLWIQILSFIGEFIGRASCICRVFDRRIMIARFVDVGKILPNRFFQHYFFNIFIRILLNFFLIFVIDPQSLWAFFRIDVPRFYWIFFIG